MSRDAFTQVLASLAAAISLLERGGKKAAASDQMFEQMLDDYRAALEAGRDALSQQTEHQTIRLPARKAVPKLEDEDGGRRTDIYTQRVMVAKAWNAALDVVAELNAAPIAQTTRQPEEVNAAIRNLRCIAKTVLSGESKASMRADLESAAQLLIRLSTHPEQTAQGVDHD